MEAESRHKTLHCLIYERQQAASEVRVFSCLPFPKQEQRQHTAESETVVLMKDTAFPIHPAASGVSSCQ